MYSLGLWNQSSVVWLPLKCDQRCQRKTFTGPHSTCTLLTLTLQLARHWWNTWQGTCANERSHWALSVLSPHDAEDRWAVAVWSCRWHTPRSTRVECWSRRQHGGSAGPTTAAHRGWHNKKQPESMCFNATFIHTGACAIHPVLLFLFFFWPMSKLDGQYQVTTIGKEEKKRKWSLLNWQGERKKKKEEREREEREREREKEGERARRGEWIASKQCVPVETW